VIDMRVCRRLMPFREHRSWREVLETEALLKRQARGENMMLYGARLQSLLSRATMPNGPDREPPAAA
jgi:hypothetical protein